MRLFARSQRWQCVPCRRTILVVFHTAESQPEERVCRCGRPMGLILFETADAPRSEEPPAKRVRA